MTASWVLSDYRGITSILHRFFKEFFLYYSSSYIRLGVLNYLLPWFEASIRWDEMFCNYFKILPRTLNFPVLISYTEALHFWMVILSNQCYLLSQRGTSASIQKWKEVLYHWKRWFWWPSTREVTIICDYRKVAEDDPNFSHLIEFQKPPTQVNSKFPPFTATIKIERCFLK